MSAYKEPPPSAEQHEQGSNAFLDELTSALEAKPITPDMGIPNLSDPEPEVEMYTLRRLWVPQDDDALGSRSLLETVMEYKKQATVCSKIGLTLLNLMIVRKVANSAGSLKPTEENMELAAAKLPQELRLTVSKARVLNRHYLPSGKYFVGFRFDDKSNERVWQDQKSILGSLRANRIRISMNEKPHTSIFFTRDRALADELADKLQGMIDSPARPDFYWVVQGLQRRNYGAVTMVRVRSTL